MLSSGMREDATNAISLPDKDPDEWREFYKIIDPSQIGEVRNGSVIDEDNAVMLTAWFHEFSMEKHLKECDDVLADKVEELSCWSDKDRGRLTARSWMASSAGRRERFTQLIELLEHSCKYELTRTIHEVELTLGSLLRYNLQDCQALFDVGVIGRILLMCLPVTRNNARFISEGACKNLWHNHLSAFLAPQRANITVDMVNNNEMFPLLLHSYMQQIALRRGRPTEQHTASRRSIPSRPSGWMDRIRPEDVNRGFSRRGVVERERARQLAWEEFSDSDDSVLVRRDPHRPAESSSGSSSSSSEDSVNENSPLHLEIADEDSDSNSSVSE